MTTATSSAELTDLQHCISLLVEGKPHTSCCCRTADECFEAADRATVRLMEMDIPRWERILRLIGRWADREETK
jgi:hypothetical protein